MRQPTADSVLSFSQSWYVSTERPFLLQPLIFSQKILFLAAQHPYQEPHTRHDLGHMEVKCWWCGALHWMNEKLSHSTTSSPVFGLCCNSGKVVLPILRELPRTLKALLERNDRQGKDFRENIWKYNSAFAFTSLQVTEDHSVNERR